MAHAPSPLVGFNTNIRHKNRNFHVQTEDSGVSKPHVITHVFIDGGRILKSVKTSYADYVGTDTLLETLRQLMKSQHQGMVSALRGGELDDVIAATLDPRSQRPEKVALSTRTKTTEAPESPAPLSGIDIAPLAQPQDTSDAVGVKASAGETSDHEAERKGIPTESPPSSAEESARTPWLTLDFDALERASFEGASPLMLIDSKLPPPIQQPRTKGNSAQTTYRTIESPPALEATLAPSPPPPRSRGSFASASNPPPIAGSQDSDFTEHVTRRMVSRPAPISQAAPVSPGGSQPPSRDARADRDVSLEEALILYLRDEA